MLVVLVVASGAAWESTALTILNGDPGIVVLKRCVDLDDLLATASSGQAQAAVVGLETPGLDASAVDHLRGAGVRPVAVADAPVAEAARIRAARIGIGSVLGDSSLADLAALLAAEEGPVRGGAASGWPTGPLAAPESTGTGEDGVGRKFVVWGPAGAPGRSTLAAGIAAEIARRATAVVLIDADPYGGTLAQQLGVLDEASGLLAAARLSATGALGEHFTGTARGLGPHLSLVSGLPRADRWVELRHGAVEDLIETAAGRGHVVVDVGFSLEQDPGADIGGRPGRHHATLAALSLADEVVVVGAADPVGLSRLARGLVEVREHLPNTPVRVVINRMRATLGWTEQDITAMISGYVRPEALHFLPNDSEAVDRALVTGRTLLECGESPLVRSMAAVVDGLLEDGSPKKRADGPASSPRFRRRRAGTTRLR